MTRFIYITRNSIYITWNNIVIQQSPSLSTINTIKYGKSCQMPVASATSTNIRYEGPTKKILKPK